jgi:hypothetical protein
MDTDRLRGPDAALEIGLLAFGHLGFADELSYAPSIHLAKAAIARARIAPQVPADEPLLVVHDATFLGSGTRGFAVTEHHFCFRSALGAPRAIPWEELRSSAIQVRGRLGIGRDTLHVRSELIEDTAAFLEEMGRRLAVDKSTLYRRAATLDRSEGADAEADALALLVWRHLGALGGARYHPFISAPRVARSRAALGRYLPARETPTLVYSDTLTLAPQGFVITPERLAWYAGDSYDGPGGRGAFQWSKLEPSQIRAEGTTVFVRGAALPWLMRMGTPDGAPAAMVALFRELAGGAAQRRATSPR